MVSETPTDGRCNYEYTPTDDYGHDSGYCEGHPMDNGRCFHHGGQEHNGGDGGPEGNDWAAKHGAYSESFVEDFLTDSEIKRVEQLKDILETPEGAQADARFMAAILKEQWRRTGDERFARRYESICDTFGIAPADEVEVTGEDGGPLEVAINRTVTDHADE